MKELVSLCTTALVAALLTGTMLFSSGCTCLFHSDQPYGPKVTGDGTGGAIAVYEDIKGSNQHDFYVQKISPEGDILWGDKGVLIGGGYKEFDSFHELHIVSDGYGGALVSWLASVSSEQRTYATYVVRVDAEGDILWKKEVRAVDQMICDGSGGAFIGYLVEGTAMILRIDAEGDFPWGEEGISLGLKSASWGWQMVSDEVGGILAVQQNENGQILVQRIDSDGNILWGEHGILLYSPLEGISAEQAQLINDGSGGAIAVWQQWPKGRIESGMPEALLNDICAQRVDAKGKVLWVEGGVPLGITKGGGECPTNPLTVSDSSGGAIIIWEDLRKGLMSMYAQKIDADGNIKWQPGGEEVCYIETHSSFWPRTAVSDGSGGAIVTFGIRAQKIDADGRTMWPDDGILFTERGTHAMAYDGYGGAVIAWGSGKSMFKSERSYVQRIDSGGKLLWGEEGIRLNP